MKKFFIGLITGLFILSLTSAAMAGSEKKQGNGPGPAPQSGDGVPDGPGW